MTVTVTARQTCPGPSGRPGPAPAPEASLASDGLRVVTADAAAASSRPPEGPG
jgi:hypothetical protein